MSFLLTKIKPVLLNYFFMSPSKLIYYCSGSPKVQLPTACLYNNKAYATRAIKYWIELNWMIYFNVLSFLHRLSDCFIWYHHHYRSNVKVKTSNDWVNASAIFPSCSVTLLACCADNPFIGIWQSCTHMRTGL